MNDDLDKVILTDADGVLLNWEYAFKTWMKTKGYKIEHPEARDEYGVQHQYNISKALKDLLVLEFNASAAMGFLPSMRDSIHYVKKLHEEEGYVFHVITSMSDDRHAKSLRKSNLRKLFGRYVFEKFIILGCGEDKTEVLNEYRDSGLMWIEDKLENAELGRDLGLDSILIAHGHNQGDHGIPRYSKWKGIYNRILGE